VRLLLNEIADRLERGVDLFVQPAVDPERLLEPDRSHGHLVGGGAIDHRRTEGALRRGRHRGRKAEQDQERGAHHARGRHRRAR
jgi:hypothetical protein